VPFLETWIIPCFIAPKLQESEVREEKQNMEGAQKVKIIDYTFRVHQIQSVTSNVTGS